jgi:hypothetical protein
LASEVNDKALKKTDVYALIKEITDAEQELMISVTNKSVKNLMDLYQKAIEYYSALDNNAFEDFLNRMTGLFKREDIQKALSQPDEEVKAEEPESAEPTAANEPTTTDGQNTSINTENSEGTPLID